MKFCMVATILASCVAEEPTAEIDQELNGDNWVTVDQYDPNNDGASAQGVAIQDNGRIIVVGYEWDGNGGLNSQWFIRSSVDGVHFTTDQTYQANRNADSLAQRVGVDTKGNIFVSGYGTDGAGRTYWLTLGSTTGNHGSYNLVDKQLLPAGMEMWVEAVVGFDGSVYVLANEWDPVSFADIHRLRTSRGGAGWHDIQVPDGVFALCATAKQLVGVGTDAASNGDWATYAYDGSSWKIVDRIVAGTGMYTATACAQVGNEIYVAGRYEDPNDAGNNEWIVRRSPDLGTWTTDDMWLTTTIPTAVTGNSVGRVVVAGTKQTGPTTHEWSWHARSRLGGWIDSDEVFTPGVVSTPRDAAWSSHFGTIVVGDGAPSYTATVRRLW